MCNRRFKKEFTKAVNGRCLKKVKIYAEKIKDVNLPLTDKGETALHLAVIQNDLCLVKLLLNLGADINSTTNKKETALHLTVDNDNSAKAKAKQNPSFGQCNEDIVKYLLSQSINANLQDIFGQSALHIVVASSNESYIKILLREKVDTNLAMKNGSTALHCAVAVSTDNKKKMTIVESLAESGAQIMIKNKMGETACHLAVRQNNFNLVRYLISKGADVNCRNNTECTPMFAAIKHCNLKMMKLLIKNGAEVNVFNNAGDNLLHYTLKNVAKGEKRLDLIKLLLRNGLDINAQNNDGCSALFVALEIDDEDLVHFLLMNGIYPNTVNFDRRTPLHVAIAQPNSQKWVEILLSHGAVANENSPMYPENADPLLCLAIVQKQTSLIRLLLDHGSDMHKSCRFSRTPLNNSICNDLHTMTNLMLKRGADVNLRDQYGDTPLHLAVQKFNFRSHGASIKLVEYLLSLGADLNKEDRTGYTPLTMILNAPFFSLLDEYTIPPEPSNTLIRHMALMIVKKQPIGPQNFTAVFRKPELFHLFLQCLKEIFFMGMTKLGNSNISYYKLLVGEKNQLARYAQNKEVAYCMETESYKIRYIGNYNKQLINGYLKGKQRLNLIEQARRKLIELAPVKLPVEIASYICEYLSNRSLNNLQNTSLNGRTTPSPRKFTMNLRSNKRICSEL